MAVRAEPSMSPVPLAASMAVIAVATATPVRVLLKFAGSVKFWSRLKPLL